MMSMVFLMAGLNRFSDKDRRRQRLRNHVARDLALPKYHQRVIEPKRIMFEKTWSEEIDDSE